MTIPSCPRRDRLVAALVAGACLIAAPGAVALPDADGPLTSQAETSVAGPAPNAADVTDSGGQGVPEPAASPSSSPDPTQSRAEHTQVSPLPATPDETVAPAAPAPAPVVTAMPEESSQSEDVPAPEPIDTPMTWIVRDNDIAVGVAVPEGHYERYEYRWMSYHVDSGTWFTISDWSDGNWSSWAQDKGTYWLHVEVRDRATKTVVGQNTVAFAHSPGRYRITGTYAGGRRGGSVLLGLSSSNPRGRYATMIYDVARKTWVAQFPGQWATWRPSPGVYWTHFVLYTPDGQVQDTRTYAFGVSGIRSHSMALVGQPNGYFCGPTAGFMALTAVGAWRSAVDGSGLTINALASRDYMNTVGYGYTSFHDRRFEYGMNRWLGKQVYHTEHTPSVDAVRQSVLHSFETGYPTAVDEQERRGGPHFNGHANSTFSHIMVVKSYDTTTDAVEFADPGVSLWGGARSTFWYPSLATFTRTYLQQEIMRDGRQHIGIYTS